ncbi:MAG: type II toxin-antitoxin system HicA family toxin [Candidatus Pacebacteria bacterium]|nr:type II toxin-antitoxin system HicA family toxin [Candidatus Paceibacterota bacterium]
MSQRVATLKAKDVISALKKMGFYEVRQKGSHLCFQHSDGRFTLVPCHSGEDIGRGLLRQILREINVSPVEFSNFL